MNRWIYVFVIQFMFIIAAPDIGHTDTVAQQETDRPHLKNDSDGDYREIMTVF